MSDAMELQHVDGHGEQNRRVHQRFETTRSLFVLATRVVIVLFKVPLFFNELVLRH